VTVAGTPSLTLNTTPAQTAAYASGSGTPTLTFDYTVQAGDTSADLDYASTAALALSGGTIRDVAANDATLTLPTVGGASSLGGQKNIVVDTTTPTVMSRTVSGTTLDVTYSEPVGGSPSTSDFTATLNGSADAVDAVSIVSGNVVRLTLHDAAHHLDAVTVTYSGSAVTDLVGNVAATYTGQSATNLTPNANPAAATLSTPNDGVFINSPTPTLTAGFADPDPLDFGKVTFQVCTDSSCSASLGTFASTATNLNVGQNGSGAVPAGFNLQTATQYWWRAKSVDSSTASAPFSAARTFTVDTTAPSVSASAAPGAGAGYQFYDGAAKTLWLNANQAGDFSLAASAADAQSGIASVDFPSIFGASANNDPSSPYQSSTYSFDGTGTPFGSPGAVTVTASNGVTVPAPNTSTDQVTISADGASPAPFGLGVPADTAKIGTGIAVSAAPTDAGSGLRQVAFFYCDASGGPCVPSVQIGSTQTVPAAGIYSVNWATTSLTDGHDYAVEAVATDNVGNTRASTISTVTVDNSAPSVSVAAPVAVTGNAFQSYDAANQKLWLNDHQSGSFKLRANADDPHSGISSVTFPALLGSGSNAGTPVGGGVYDSSVYSFSSPSAPGLRTITAANGVTNPGAATSSAGIDVGVDGAAPATNPAFPLNNGSYDNTTWNPGCTTAGICGTVTDGGSGVAQVNVSIKDRTTGKYYGGTTFDQPSQTFLTASLAGNNWSYALDQSKLTSPHAYLVELYSVDNVSNSDAHQQIRFTYGGDTGAPTTTLSLTGATHAYLGVAPYVLYYGSTLGSGGFTLHASSTDPSGVDTVSFPDLSGAAGFSGSGGTSSNGGNDDPFVADSPAYSFTSLASTAPGLKNVTSTDLRGNAVNDSVTFVVDNAAPTGGTLTVNGGNAYSTTATFPVSHLDYSADGGGSGVASSTFTVASATLANGTCGSFGSPVPAADGPFAGADSTCYRFTLTGTDHVDNVASTSFDMKVDTTAPSQPSAVFSGLSSGNTFDNGLGTLYYRPSAGGAFSVNVEGSMDAESGIRDYTFSPLTGFSGPTQTDNRLDVPFNGSSTGGGSFTVHSTNNAGLDSASATYDVTSDSTAPSGGGLTVNGSTATSGGTSSYLTSGGSVSLSTTPYADGVSGVASQVVTVRQASLANDSCGSYGSSTAVGGATYSVSTGNCYLFTLTATDNVGNVTIVRTTVKVDTTGPVSPTVAYTGASAGNTFLSGTALYYRPSTGGTFTVHANGASDPETGIKSGNAGYTFSALAGFLSSAQAGSHVDVTFDGSSTGEGTYSVAATNNAGIASTPSEIFTITKDSDVPTGGLLGINPYSSLLTVSVPKTDFTDALSGIASNVVTRSNPVTPTLGGGCPAGPYAGATVVPGATDTVPSDASCYEYTLTGTDNVGNVDTYHAIVLVDTTGPAGGSVSYANGPLSLSGIPVSWSSGTDDQSGLAGTVLERASAALSGSTCGSFGSFSPILGATSPYVDTNVSAGNCYAYRVVVTNNTGVSSTFSSVSVAQLTAASPFQLAPGNPAGAYLPQGGTTLFLGPNAQNLPWKLELTADGRSGVTQATWQGKSSGPITSAPAADSTPTNAPFYSGVYKWDGTPVNDTIQLTRDPSATVDLLTVSSDLNAPTGSVSYTDGTYSSHSVHVNTSAGDGESGVASTQVERSEAPLVGATCGAWSSFAPVTLNGSGNDTTVVDNTCYRYQVVITDNVGNTFTAGSASIAQIPDITAPTFVTAATNVAGTQLTVTMSEPLDATATTPASAFTITYDGVVQPTATGISVSGSTVTLDLATPPNNSQDVKIRYAQPSTSGDRMRDNATPTKNETANFGPAAVVSNTPDTVAPSITSAAATTSTISLVFDDTLSGAAPDAGAFTVTTGATTRSVSNVTMNGKIVTLTISPALTSNDNVVVTYSVPALNALHDAVGNNTAPFTFSAANQTPVVAPPASGGGGLSASPALVSSSPDDGSTVRAVSTITLTANESATWTHMTVTRPDGTVTPLADDAGQSAAWPFATSVPGLYVIRGTLSAGGQNVDVLSHFTVWVPPTSGTGVVPPVEKNAVPYAAGVLQSSDARTLVSWPAGAFSDSVVVEILPKPASAVPSLPPDALVVQVTAFLRSTHAPVTDLGGVVDISFPNATQGAHPLHSADGTSWTDIPELPTLNLPAGQQDGWFRDSDGTIHVLSTQLSYYALVGQQVSTKLAMRIITVRRLWLHHRPFIAVRMTLTMPARVTGVFVAPDGSTVAGQSIKTPTRRAGVTILRVPLRITKTGLYRLQMHAEAAGQAVNRTAKINFVAAQPASPVWQDGALRVAVIRGAGGLGSLDRLLGKRFVVRRIADAALYDVLDTTYRTSAAAVVVDLGTVPIYTLVELHALLPEVKIVGLTATPARAAYYRSIGLSVVLPRTASPAQVAHAIKSLTR
jgi:hypothetical protein